MKRYFLPAAVITLVVGLTGCNQAVPPTGVGPGGVGVGTCPVPANAVANIGNNGGMYTGLTAPAELKDKMEAEITTYLDTHQNEVWWKDFKCLYPDVIKKYTSIAGKTVK